jgi:hypothetical protein
MPLPPWRGKDGMGGERPRLLPLPDVQTGTCLLSLHGLLGEVLRRLDTGGFRTPGSLAQRPEELMVGLHLPPTIEHQRRPARIRPKPLG